MNFSTYFMFSFRETQTKGYNFYLNYFLMANVKEPWKCAFRFIFNSSLEFLKLWLQLVANFKLETSRSKLVF